MTLRKEKDSLTKYSEGLYTLGTGDESTHRLTNELCQIGFTRIIQTCVQCAHLFQFSRMLRVQLGVHCTVACFLPKISTLVRLVSCGWDKWRIQNVLADVCALSLPTCLRIGPKSCISTDTITLSWLLDFVYNFPLFNTVVVAVGTPEDYVWPEIYLRFQVASAMQSYLDIFFNLHSHEETFFLIFDCFALRIKKNFFFFYFSLYQLLSGRNHLPITLLTVAEKKTAQQRW